MAKRTAWLHVDFAGLPGVLITERLLAHREELRAHGVTVPVAEPREVELAVMDQLRTHRDHGLRRRDVEGAWARIARRAWKGRRHPVVSVPGFAGATPEQLDLVLDFLAGLKVHVLATVPEGEPQPAALALWEGRLKPGRLHRLVVDPADPHVEELVWARLTELVGLPGVLVRSA